MAEKHSNFHIIVNKKPFGQNLPLQKEEAFLRQQAIFIAPQSPKQNTILNFEKKCKKNFLTQIIPLRHIENRFKNSGQKFFAECPKKEKIFTKKINLA